MKHKILKWFSLGDMIPLNAKVITADYDKSLDIKVWRILYEIVIDDGDPAAKGSEGEK